MWQRLWNITTEVFHETELLRDHSHGSKATIKTAVTCVTAALCLTMTYYLGTPAAMTALIGPGDDFAQKLWWASMVITFYLLVPALVVRWGFREPLRQYGFQVKLPARDLPMYLALLTFVLLIVVVFSATASFQDRYPFFKPPAHEALWPRFWIWEAAYLIQFVAVEFFFRGFLLHALKLRTGFSAVFLAMIPYCLIHFGKPLPETLGAIIAGIVLGVLSLKSRSIAPGVLLHGGVALGMDLAVLVRQGLLF